MKRLLTILVLSGVAVVMFASSASALVIVDHVTTESGPLAIGSIFDVDVIATWDGARALLGIFSSTRWDSSQLTLINAGFPPGPRFETRPVLFSSFVYYPGLDRFGTIAAGVAGDDLTSTARTVQYRKAPPAVIPPFNGTTTTQLVVRLTFQTIGGVGIREIEGFFNVGDIGATGDAFVFGTNVAVAVVPEPDTIVLVGLGLAGASQFRRKAVAQHVD